MVLRGSELYRYVFLMPLWDNLYIFVCIQHFLGSIFKPSYIRNHLIREGFQCTMIVVFVAFCVSCMLIFCTARKVRHHMSSFNERAALGLIANNSIDFVKYP